MSEVKRRKLSDKVVSVEINETERCELVLPARVRLLQLFSQFCIQTFQLSSGLVTAYMRTPRGDIMTLRLTHPIAKFCVENGNGVVQSTIEVNFGEPLVTFSFGEGGRKRAVNPHQVKFSSRDASPAIEYVPPYLREHIVKHAKFLVGQLVAHSKQTLSLAIISRMEYEEEEDIKPDSEESKVDLLREALKLVEPFKIRIFDPYNEDGNVENDDDGSENK